MVDFKYKVTDIAKDFGISTRSTKSSLARNTNKYV